MAIDEEIEEGRRRSTSIGLFISLLILALIIGAIVGFATWKSRGLDYTLHFEDAKGLQAGDPVVLSGVQIGQVRKVTLMGEDDVRVAVHIDEEHRKKVLAGSTAVITSMSFPNMSGQKVVEIHNPADPDALPLEDDVDVAGQDGMFDLKAWQLEQRLSDMGEDLSAQSKVLAEKFSEMAEKLQEIPESPEMKEALEKLEEFSEDLETSSREKLADLSDDWEKWSKDLSPLIEEWKVRGKQKAWELLQQAMESKAEKSTPVPDEKTD